MIPLRDHYYINDLCLKFIHLFQLAVFALVAVSFAQDDDYYDEPIRPRPAPARIQPGYSGPSKGPAPTPVPILKQINRLDHDYPIWIKLFQPNHINLIQQIICSAGQRINSKLHKSKIGLLDHTLKKNLYFFDLLYKYVFQFFYVSFQECLLLVS